MSPMNKATLPPRILILVCAVILALVTFLGFDGALGASLRFLAGAGALIGLGWFLWLRRKLSQ